MVGVREAELPLKSLITCGVEHKPYKGHNEAPGSGGCLLSWLWQWIRKHISESEFTCGRKLTSEHSSHHDLPQITVTTIGTPQQDHVC